MPDETVKCHYCWKDIPADADVCPQCGISRHRERPGSDSAPPKKSGALVATAIGAVVVAAVVVWLLLR